MPCDKHRDRFSELYEDTLSADETQRIESHLDSCAQCADEYRQFSAVMSAFRELEPVEPPGQLLEQIRSAIDATEQLPSPASRLVKLGPAIVAACLFILLSGVFMQQSMREAATVSSEQSTAMARGSSNVVGSTEPIAETASAAAEPSVAAPTRASDDRRVGADTTPNVHRKVAATAPGARSAGDREAVRSRLPAVVPPGHETGSRPKTGEASDDIPGVVAHAEAVLASASRMMSPPEQEVAAVSGGSMQKDTDSVRYFDVPQNAASPPRMMLPASPVPDESSLSVRFIPPPMRRVGVAEVCAVVLTAEHNMSEVSVRVEPRHGLRLPGLTGGKLYQGPLAAGQAKQIEFRMVSEDDGTQRMRVSVETPVSGLQAQLEVVLPGFEVAKKQVPANPLGAPITTVFRDTPIRQAFLQIARQGRVSLVLGADVGGHRVNYSCTDVPAGSVVRILAETYGFDVELTDDTYHVRARAHSSDM